MPGGGKVGQVAEFIRLRCVAGSPSLCVPFSPRLESRRCLRGYGTSNRRHHWVELGRWRLYQLPVRARVGRGGRSLMDNANASSNARWLANLDHTRVFPFYVFECWRDICSRSCTLGGPGELSRPGRHVAVASPGSSAPGCGCSAGEG